MEYYGMIKTKAQALSLAKKLRKNGTPRAIDGAKLLERNWHAIASRPAIQPELFALSECTPLYREDSIVNTIIKGGIK